MHKTHIHQWAAALALLLPFAAAAANAAQTAPVVKPAASLTAGVRETFLPNGLRVITKEVHSAPVVSFAVWYRVGSRNEHNGITGTSHLLEHLMFKGTRKYGLGEISRTLSANGAEFNAATFYDWTEYFETLSSDRLELAMQIESDRMEHSRIDKADLDSEMSVVRSELEGHENSPGTFLSQAVAATAFEAHPYHWPVIGWRSDVENVPRDAIYQYYRTHYGPNNATVVIVGDFKTEQALAMVRRYFGVLPKIPTPAAVYTTEPAQRGERRVIERRVGSLPMVELAYKVPGAKDPDNYALDTIANILSSGRASRLYQGLVEKQVATEADAGNPEFRDPYLFTFTATAAPGVTADRLEGALHAEAERLKTEPVSAEELARAKSQLEAQFAFQNDSVSDQASQLGYWASVYDWRFLSTYLDRIRALTPADLQRVARKYFNDTSLTVGQFIPTAQGGPQGPPPKEAGARVEKGRNDRPIPLPRPAPTPKVDRHITRFTLGNGVRVIVQENHSNATFALRGSLDAGAVVEPADKRGVAGLTAMMLTRGTEHHSALEFATELESVGAALEASADPLQANIAGRAEAKDFNRLVDLLAEMLRQPTFPTEALQRLKGLALAGLEQAKDDPSSLASRAFSRAIYPEGNPLRPLTLDEAARSIQGITREDLESFYRKQYGPDHMILVVAGDVRADQVRQALESRLGDWARNPSAAPIPSISVPLAAATKREVVQVPDKSETEILYGFAGGLKRSDPDFYATQVLNMVLGGGGALNSRLGNVIRDQQGLAYGVSSFFDANLYPGPFEVELGTNPANAEKAVCSLQQQVERVRQTGVTQRELDEAVAYLTGRFPLRLETNAGMAEILWLAEFYKLGPDYIDRYASYYRAVTLGQVNAAARKHLHPDRATLVISGTVPESQPRPTH